MPVHLLLFATTLHSGKLLADLPNILQLLRERMVFSQPLDAKGEHSFFGLSNELPIFYFLQGVDEAFQVLCDTRIFFFVKPQSCAYCLAITVAP
ncbi:MAG: hypothetical protein RL012_121 [Bacteroidota bacterium]|jgi:hypothetical protein